jgi:putative ABC transport system ATP-binding protein
VTSPPISTPERPPDSPIFEVVGLGKVYHRGAESVEALRDVTLSIGAGEFVVLAGPSGSGKSTLLNLMGGLDRPDTGDVRFAGRSIGHAPEGERIALRRHQLGFIFQAFNLVPVLSAFENVEYGLWLAGMPRAERRERVERALESVGLGGRMSHRPDHLSGGERQRVALARALVREPRAVLADEPTASLDSRTGAAIVSLLVELNRTQGTTFVVATHDAAIADNAPRVVRLADGRIIADEWRRA